MRANAHASIRAAAAAAFGSLLLSELAKRHRKARQNILIKDSNSAPNLSLNLYVVDAYRVATNDAISNNNNTIIIMERGSIN